MKKIILSLVMLFTISTFASETVIAVSEVDCEKIMKSGDKELIARSGCCSWHGGVCGCSISGRTECCDGTLSPSCTCKGGESLDSLKPSS